MPKNPFKNDDLDGGTSSPVGRALQGFASGGLPGAVGGAIENPGKGRIFGGGGANLGNYASRLKGEVEPLDDLEQPNHGTGWDKAAKVAKLFGGI